MELRQQCVNHGHAASKGLPLLWLASGDLCQVATRMGKDQGVAAELQTLIRPPTSATILQLLLNL